MGKSGNPAKRAAQAAEATEHEYDPTPVDEHGVEDFDAFWSSRDRKRQAIRIQGETVELPPSLPLQFQMEAKRLERSTDENDIRRCVALLFGEDRVDRWAEGGMDVEQFRVLLAYVPAKLAGADVTLAYVADALAKGEAGEG